ncbi:hypothetical protein [Cohnella massiliensis]|uniref:hypothetical protein n=1 Tax=Cohnella massiliensis TaxID=1816691 RepID=UPI0009B9EE0A|nr:hypothetical protein [Cohnella massiliensis]
MSEGIKKKSVLVSVLLGACALLLVASIVRSPGEAFRASLGGFEVWWQTVFPGLLPPLILAELLAASGLLHGLAVIGEPVTRKMFRLPGVSGWAIALGWAAGAPAGARETARLREKGFVRDEDTDTLLLVSHVPSPFLVVLVIGSGFLHSPLYGWAIAAGVWLSAAAAGGLWARLMKAAAPAVPPPLPVGSPSAALRRAYRAVREARQEDGRPFGQQISDAVTHSVATLMAVGGLMMLSAVLLRMIQVAFPGADAWLAVPGVYEMHLGAYETGRSALFESEPVHAAALLAAVLAWTGFSGLLQARAVFGAGRPFPWLRFIAGRLLHAALALAFVYPLATAVRQGWLAQLVPAWAAGGPPGGTESAGLSFPGGWALSSATLATAVASIAVFLLLALLAALIRPPKRPPEP